MNSKVVLIFGLLLASSMAYTSCSWKRSSVLGWLKNVDDRIPLSKVSSRKAWKLCNSAWGAYGSCCDDTSLENSNDAIEALAKGQDSKFREVLYNSIKKYAHTATKCKNSAAVKESISQNAKETNNKCLQGLTEESAFTSIEYSHKMPKDLYSYHKYKDACYRSEVEARSSGICGGCSADLRLNLRYGWGSRLKVPDDVCEDLLSNCFSTWRFMLETSLMRYFSDMTDIDRETEIDDSALDSFTGISLKNLKEAFDACPAGAETTANTCHIHHQRLLCDAYLNRVFPGDDQNDGDHPRYKNPKICKCKWKKACKEYKFCTWHKCYKFKKCHWKCVKDDPEPEPEPEPEPGTGNTDQGTTCGCPLCDEFVFDENSGDLYVRTVQSENLDCTTMDMYSDNFISVVYTFVTPYANNQRLNSQQNVTCVPEGTSDPNDLWLTSVSARLQAAVDPNVNINRTDYDVDLVTCESNGTLVRDTNLGNGTYQRETISFYYNPQTDPFTTFENFPNETTTVTFIPAYGF